MQDRAQTRVVPFGGIANFRDIGGYPTRDGGSVRWGCVFRAAGLHGMDESDRARFDALALHTVVDLRSDHECEERPSLREARRFPLLGHAAAATEATGDSPQSAPLVLPDLEAVYIGLLDHAGAGIAEIFTILAGPDALPAVIHCHAGKDRTGTVIALLLELLGVERELVLDDYELSPRLVERDEATIERLRTYGYEPEEAAALLVASRPAMRAALIHLDEQYGGAAAYLQAAGVTPAAEGRLRDLLVER
jgi:protein-tyrosine phosphatase